jgi:hypothetical protein
VRLFLLFKLFLEFGVGFLKIAKIVLEEPCFSRPLQFQLVEFPLKIHVLLMFFLYALILCSEFLEATHPYFQLFGFLLGEFGHILCKGKD